MSFLDLPDLVLECILEKLPPEGLYKMSNVCSTLRERCVSDHLWARHLNSKWGRIVGPAAAYKQWQLHVASKKVLFDQQCNPNGLIGYLLTTLFFPLTSNSNSNSNSTSMDSSIMYCYFALQSGKLWFPAQVYNRENGHVGFMLSCYDAELSYDPKTDTFQARYPPHGRRPFAVETGITWDRVRAPPVQTSPHQLHPSDCLTALRPGDHVEIQWRRNKEFPYGWWYGVVGHLETCDGNATYCRCQDSDTLVLEFNHYARGSRWRRTIVSRRDHREEGNAAEGFYGGVRKLASTQEISMWRKFWPSQILE
ncbi:F-box protein At2g32560-like isoform X2 [Andrographis paniculata]|nr:F-box protein At2g32560-like isoform X2 [Andrographis paniculata]